MAGAGLRHGAFWNAALSGAPTPLSLESPLDRILTPR